MLVAQPQAAGYSPGYAPPKNYDPLYLADERARRERLGPAEHKGLRVKAWGRWRGWRPPILAS